MSISASLNHHHDASPFGQSHHEENAPTEDVQWYTKLMYQHTLKQMARATRSIDREDVTAAKGVSSSSNAARMAVAATAAAPVSPGPSGMDASTSNGVVTGGKRTKNASSMGNSSLSPQTSIESVDGQSET